MVSTFAPSVSHLNSSEPSVVVVVAVFINGSIDIIRFFLPFRIQRVPADPAPRVSLHPPPLHPLPLRSGTNLPVLPLLPPHLCSRPKNYFKLLLRIRCWGPVLLACRNDGSSFNLIYFKSKELYK